MQSSRKTLSPLAAVALGAMLALLAFALAELATFPSTGHRIDTTKWPPEAQAVLRETPGKPISSEQWRRIDGVLRAHGDMNYGQRPYWSQTVRASWWWFLLLPLVAAAGAALWFRASSAALVALLAGPSLAVLLLGVALAV